MDRYELRRVDYSLTEDHQALQAAYRQLLETHCPIETVWAAQGTGFDKSLWERLCATGASTMAVGEQVGGDGATLVDLTLVAEELGRTLAPVPWVDHVCAVRLAERLGAVEEEMIAGSRIVGLEIAPEPTKITAGRRLVPTAAIADSLLVLDGDELALLTFATSPARVPNLGQLPMAWVDREAADSRLVLGSGPPAAAAYRRAVDEWRVLTAAALTGLVEQAMTIAGEFAKSRYTLGVRISTLQAISHPLANMAIAVQGGRNLARRAAWFLENEPEERPELPGCAFVFMAEEAPKAATMAVHIQGGLGVSVEAAATAYLVRARGWALAGGDPGITARQVGQLVAERESAAVKSARAV